MEYSLEAVVYLRHTNSFLSRQGYKEHNTNLLSRRCNLNIVRHTKSISVLKSLLEKNLAGLIVKVREKTETRKISCGFPQNFKNK